MTIPGDRSSPIKRHSHAVDSLFVWFMLAVFSVLSFGTALHESPTIDEPLHITSGYIYWTTGKYWLSPVNTPLLRLWVSLPLTFLRLHLAPPSPDVIAQHISVMDLLLNGNRFSSDVLVDIARSMMVLLGIALGYLVWRWARELFGPLAATAALLSYCFCPAMLEFSHLATTDLGSAGLSFLSLYLFWRLLRLPSRGNAWLFGLAMGANLAAKINGIFMFPIFALLYALEPGSRLRTDRSLRNQGYLLLLTVVAMAGIILAVYRITELHRLGQGLQDLNTIVAGDPSQYFKGVHNNGSPWKWFYTVCFILKTPLPILILSSGGLLLTAANRYPEKSVAWKWILVPCVLYLATLSFGPQQYGIRRILFLYPLLCIWIGGTVAGLWAMSWKLRPVVVLLCVWYVLETLFFFPRYLSYFNALAGGPSGGYRYLSDCNLDWGQGLKALGRFLHANGIGPIYLCYFGGGTPTTYGIHYASLDPNRSTDIDAREDRALDMRREKRALLAISVTDWTSPWDPAHADFSWLKSRSPLAILMDSIWVFDLTADADAHRHLATIFRNLHKPRFAAIESDWRHPPSP